MPNTDALGGKDIFTQDLYFHFGLDTKKPWTRSRKGRSAQTHTATLLLYISCGRLLNMQGGGWRRGGGGGGGGG